MADCTTLSAARIERRLIAGAWQLKNYTKWLSKVSITRAVWGTTDVIGKAGKKRLLGLVPTGVIHSYQVRSADAFLVSYPKCGRTWLRFMLANVFTHHFGIESDNPLDLQDVARRRSSPSKRC